MTTPPTTQPPAQPTTQPLAQPVDVQVACPGADEAAVIAAAAVERRLAACGQHWPIRSVYRWRGAVERSGEELLVLKSTTDLVPALCDLVVSLHSYELPAITVTALSHTGPGYREWLTEATGRR